MNLSDVFGTLFRSLPRVLRRLLRRPVPPTEAAPAHAAPGLSAATLAQLVGTTVQHLAYYEQALTHRSILRGLPDSHLASNERLEFLGDAVLGFVVAERLYQHFPDQNEGFLTRLRAKLVNGQALAACAQYTGLGALILMSENMEQAGGRQNTTILADAYEALIGAVYLDLGLEEARRFIDRTMLDEVDLTSLAERRDNYKSLLLEYAQAKAWPQPQYRILLEEGPSHDRIFTVEVFLHDKSYGRGTASNKKQAEQQAASEALERLRMEEG